MPSVKVPHTRAKLGDARSRTKRFELGQKYISAQAAADTAGDLAAPIKEVSATRTALQALLVQRADCKAALAKVNGQIAAADYQFTEALGGYAEGAAKLSAGDSVRLGKLGVDEVVKPGTLTSDEVAAPLLKLRAGAPGALGFKSGRVRGAGAYEYQYKLEPSQPSDPWIAAGVSKNTSLEISALAHAQLVRARARAIGAAPGAWSDEVVGRAG